MLPVRVALLPGARLPEKKTAGAAAYDVAACLEPDTCIRLDPGQRMAVPTGLVFEIPASHVLSLRPRSGLALQHGITLLNAPATIDSDYRGELKVIMANLGQETFQIDHGDRIAQLLIEPVLAVDFQVVPRSELSDSPRGEGGFGSTGLA